MKHFGEWGDNYPSLLAAHGVPRRALLRLAAAITLGLLAKANARADIPMPRPLTLEERIRYSRWVFLGRLRRIVYLSPATVKKLFTPGVAIEPSDLQLYEIEDQSESPTAFLEIEDARPILRRTTIKEQESAALVRGTIYVRSGPMLDAEYKAAISSLQSKEIILFIDRERKQFGVHDNFVFPKPLYIPSPTVGNWRSGVPMSIEALPDVMRVGLYKGLLMRFGENR
jgi:hypothetical protein